jgi:hypothetical protein
MRGFLRACSAELLKMKRTLALWLAVLTPLLIVVLQFVFLLRVPQSRLKAGIWPALQGGLMFWAIFLLPLVACLLTALLNGIEHRDGNWKQIFARPISRIAVYSAKALAAHVLLAAGSASVYAGLIVAGYIGHALLPKIPFGPAPWLPLFQKLALVYVASSALIGIHLWVSARVKTFPLPLGLGVGAVLTSLIAANDKVMAYWPWMAPANTTQPDRLVAALTVGIGGGIVVVALGAWDTARRDIL